MTDLTPLPISVSLKIAQGVLDGASRQWLASTHSVSTLQVEQAWLLCRERPSTHFARAEQPDWSLLDETALRERLDDAIRLLLDWRAAAIETERFSLLDPNLLVSGTDDAPTDAKENAEGD